MYKKKLLMNSKITKISFSLNLLKCWVEVQQMVQYVNMLFIEYKGNINNVDVETTIVIRSIFLILDGISNNYTILNQTSIDSLGYIYTSVISQTKVQWYRDMHKYSNNTSIP